MSWALETWLTVVWVTSCYVSTQPNLSDTELLPAVSKAFFKMFPSASPSPAISLPLCTCNSRLKALPLPCQTESMGFEMLSRWTHHTPNRCNTQRMEYIGTRQVKEFCYLDRGEIWSICMHDCICMCMQTQAHILCLALQMMIRNNDI